MKATIPNKTITVCRPSEGKAEVPLESEPEFDALEPVSPVLEF